MLPHSFLFISAIAFTVLGFFLNPLFLALGGTIFLLQTISLYHDFIYLIHISVVTIGYGTGTVLGAGNIVVT